VRSTLPLLETWKSTVNLGFFLLFFQIKFVLLTIKRKKNESDYDTKVVAGKKGAVYAPIFPEGFQKPPGGTLTILPKECCHKYNI